MWARLIIFCVVLSSCQQGLIPCPVVETIHYKESVGRRPKQMILSATAEEPTPRVPGRRKPDRFIQNVSVEEWDCPQPGKRKYMPRSVKHNIRMNWKKLNEADSLHTSAAPLQ